MRALALLAGLALASCAQPPAGGARHAAAPESRPARPTIVSLNPCSDAVLAEVADPAQLLALSHYSQDPASSSMDVARARAFRSVSGSAEEVAALSPDVVVAGSFLAPATEQALAGMGIRVVRLPIARNVGEARDQVMALARLAGHADRGEAMVAGIAEALRRAAPPPGSPPVSAVVWQSGGIVPGEDTLIADLLRRTGFVQLSAARGLKQADMLPLEAMLADPPRVILTAGDGHSAEDRMLSHPALARLQGTRRERLDPSLLWCGGPTVARAAARLAQVRRAR